MSIRTEFSDALIAATAHRLTVDSDPSSPTYGDETQDTGFAVGMTQLDGRQLRELGRELTTRAYTVFADREGQALEVNAHEKLRIAGRGDFDVLSVKSIEDQLGFDGIVLTVEEVS